MSIVNTQPTPGRTIYDRKGLERAACGCYRSAIATYQQTLGNAA